MLWMSVRVGLGEKVSDSAAKCIHSYSQQTFKELLLCLGIGQENVNWECKAEGRWKAILVELTLSSNLVIIQVKYYPLINKCLWVVEK